VKKFLEIRNAPLSVTGVAEIFQCDISGQVTIDPSTGSIIYNNCQDFPDVITNGSILITINAEDPADPNNLSGTFSANLQITVSGFPVVRFTGGFSFTINLTGSVEKVTITGSSLIRIDPMQADAMTNFILVSTFDPSTGTTTNVDFTLASTAIGGVIVFDTLESSPFHTHLFRIHPHTGEADITGANGTRLHITVMGDETLIPAENQVQIGTDTNGDGVIDTTNTYSWAQLELGP
jgi:hypothetical protein